MSDLEIKDVHDAHLLIKQLADMDKSGDPFEDAYYFDVYQDVVEGIDDLELGLDIGRVETVLAGENYVEATEMVDEAVTDDEPGSINYELPRVGDDPFRPSVLQTYQCNNRPGF